MLSEEEILNVVREECDGELRLTQEVAYSRSSPAFSLVKFRCLLQDTGYPKEVYMAKGKLEERWVGWAVEVPGEQAWCKELGFGLSLEEPDKLPERKYPLGGDYLGALVKVYGEGYAPASVHTFIGIVSRGYLEEVEVPAIHVLREVVEMEREGQGEGLVDYLATAFEPADRIAGELLMLALISAPTSRPPGLPPLGTLSVNFLGAGEGFVKMVQSVMPVVVEMALSGQVLEGARFAPSSNGQDLDAGRLQLGPGTVLIVEDGIREGKLENRAVENLRDLQEVMTEQKLRYDYPYMKLRMDCAIRVVVLSEAKSLLPVDMVVPRAEGVRVDAKANLEDYRRYLQRRRRLDIPEEVGRKIEEDFVGWTGKKVDALTRRMKLARLIALSRDGKLTVGVWERAIWLDEQVIHL